MKTKAAILWEVNTPWSVEEIELDPPKPGEVLVKLAASGMCHSDEHLVTGDLPFALPIIGGHEGAGVVQEVGDGRQLARPRRPRRVRVHPVAAVVARAARPATQNLCDLGALHGPRHADRRRHRPATTPRARTSA